MSLDPIAEQIKATVDLVDYIGRTVALKRAGKTYKGLCPFHNERSPSFYVWPGDTPASWHCFGCHEGGDIISFAEKEQECSYVVARDALAEEYGIVTARRDFERERTQRLLAGINAAAARYMHEALLVSRGGAAAREYLAGRGVRDETIKTFEIGYLPQGGYLHRYLTTKGGYASAIVHEAGLAAGSESRDLFGGRVILPIRDVQGRIAGFGGRLLGEGKTKYLNSPETALFDKGALLFGFAEAHEELRRSGVAVIVEGYFDAIIAHQEGRKNVLAVIGTAITPQHVKLLTGAGVGTVVLALDPDRAGKDAALRAVEEVLASGRSIELRIAVLPEGEDPDEMILRDGAAWDAAIAAALPVRYFYLADLIERGEMDAAEVITMAQGIRDTAARLAYSTFVRDRFGIVVPDAPPEIVIDQEVVERRALGIALRERGFAARIHEEWLTSPDRVALLALLRDGLYNRLREGRVAPEVAAIEALSPAAARSRLDHMRDLTILVGQLRRLHLARERETLMTLADEAHAAGDGDAATRFMAQARALA